MISRRGFLGLVGSVPFFGFLKGGESAEAKSSPVRVIDASGNVFTNCEAVRGAPYEVYAGDRYKGSFETFQEAWAVVEPHDTILAPATGTWDIPHLERGAKGGAS